MKVASRIGSTTMRARISDRMPPGVVYTTFHFPVTGANVVTTDYSDWATNCPEYKVTAVEVRPTLAAGGLASPEDLGLQPHDGSARSHAREALVRMANQIAAEAQTGGVAAAAAQVAGHLTMFWTTAMKADLIDHASSGAGDLAPAVLAALDSLSVEA